MVVNPFGEILAECDENPGIVYADIDFSEIEERKRAMPLQHQKRKDLYSFEFKDFDCTYRRKAHKKYSA